MKIPRAKLRQLIYEELSSLNEFGGLAGYLGAARPDQSAPLEDQPDSIIQEEAIGFFMNLGVGQKESQVMAQNIATSDLIDVMRKISKIDTADEEIE